MGGEFRVLHDNHSRDNRHHHRSSRDSGRLRESEERHHSDRYREEKHRNDDRHRSTRERSHEPRNEREGSRDERIYHEESVERRSSHKRKDREQAESEDRPDRTEKRSKSSKEEKRDKRRFEDRDVHDSREERRDKRRVDEDKGVGDSRELNGNVKEERGYEEERMRDENGGRHGHAKRERRRFGDKVKQEVSDVKLEKEQFSGNPNGSSSQRDGAALESLILTSSVIPELSSESSLPPTKVSSISTTNENKGVSVTRSHEVPGKFSTDGTTASAAGKGGNLLSLGALAKAKKVLQMQKGLEEKLKRIPRLNKPSTTSSDAIPKLALNEGLPALGSVPLTTVSANTSAHILPAANSTSVIPSVSGLPPISGLANASNVEAVKRAQVLAAQMGFRQDPEFAPLINMFPGQIPTDVTVQKPAKAPVLRLDALGREIDEHGNVINVAKPPSLSTLKVNINKQKKEAFQILKPELDVDPESNPHFDPEMGINKAKLLRPKRMTFQFVEEGKWENEAKDFKHRNAFGEAQAKELKMKQAQLDKAKNEPNINPNFIEVAERVIIKEKPKDPIPEVEWWDMPLLPSGTYGEMTKENVTEDKLKLDKITIYIEHPLPIEPPAEAAPPPPQPLKLTKKEQKKLRTQRRLAKEKDKQEMIRQGVIEPPKPKVKMSNIMKVLGAEATQDPTRLEMEIRSAAAEREQAHVDRNIARKLTPAERKEKKVKKLFEDPNTLETIVSIYKMNDLSHPQTRFKVDINARENRLSGCAVITDGMCVVVVEGGSKAIKRYGKLMLRRINWAAAVADEEDDEDEDKPVNKCVLVWQGSVARPSFSKFTVHRDCRTETGARKFFSDAGVGHYWDLAVNFRDEDM